jgi:glutamine amidotransferase
LAVASADAASESIAARGTTARTYSRTSVDEDLTSQTQIENQKLLMTKTVTIVDYGLGNIFSVSRALQHLGFRVQLTDRPVDIANASYLVLPGVGAFENGMRGLRERNLINPLCDYAASGRPLLGICLGMQLLFSHSEEFGMHEGLGVIPGTVVPIPENDSEGAFLKRPHIGWSPLRRPESNANSDSAVMAGIAENSAVYFVHSFCALPEKDEHRLVDTYYGGNRITAAVQDNKVIGCQFHPEKSGVIGLRIIQNFVNEL